MKSTILVTGYKNFELGIFQDKDPRITIIKKAIDKDFRRFLENGADWFIFMGNLGFEYWALEVALDLQKEYDFQIATIFTFENHGQNWNEANKAKLALFKQVDFVKYTFPSYENRVNLNNTIIFSLTTHKVHIFFMILKMKLI